MSSLMLSGPFDTAELPRVAHEPVTLTVARHVEPGYEAEFLAWTEEVMETLSKFHGSLGAGVLHPGPDGGDYQLVFRFVDGLHLREWERSPQRAALMAKADRFVTGSRVHRTVGVENWFDLPLNAEPKRSLWRRVATDVAWVYPVAIGVSLFVAPLIARLPVQARVLISSLFITLVMRLGIGPLRGKLRSKRRM